MMSGNPVGFGQARISISSVVPVPVAILKDIVKAAPIKSAFGMFVCVHGTGPVSVPPACAGPA
jgi:hypothetical protein